MGGDERASSDDDDVKAKTEPGNALTAAVAESVLINALLENNFLLLIEN